MRHIVLVYEKVERWENTVADFSDYNRDKTDKIIQSAQQSHDSYHSLKPILKTDRSDLFQYLSFEFGGSRLRDGSPCTVQGCQIRIAK
ncbi:hypothetical protein AVEN_237485-1 [Araneus ventricosus]|uniref:Uncharacterized protein n=1 Tax=Araneus ventricosus TaxID=182803 RepID=A0A4Y2V4B2_ARAVE|nr:hypothetical protein AVEN_237485-1 [Araneus ventricosus]